MDDKALQTQVSDELSREPSLTVAYISVAVQSRIAHLTGRLTSYPQKLAAEAAVKRVKGVWGWSEREVVEKAAWSAPGVTAVDRRLAIRD